MTRINGHGIGDVVVTANGPRHRTAGDIGHEKEHGDQGDEVLRQPPVLDGAALQVMQHGALRLRQQGNQADPRQPQ